MFYRFRDTIYWWKILFFRRFYPLQSHAKPSQGGSLYPRVRKSVSETGVSWLLYGENCVIVRSLVLSQYQRVTDRRTYRHIRRLIQAYLAPLAQPSATKTDVVQCYTKHRAVSLRQLSFLYLILRH